MSWGLVTLWLEPALWGVSKSNPRLQEAKFGVLLKPLFSSSPTEESTVWTTSCLDSRPKLFVLLVLTKLRSVFSLFECLEGCVICIWAMSSARTRATSAEECFEDSHRTTLLQQSIFTVEFSRQGRRSS